jgi:hypothetical protein
MPRWILTFSLALAALLISSPAVKATEQEEDVIHQGARIAYLLERPLNLHLLTLTPIPKFDRARTSNWKGYTATWEIRDSKLYLIAFEASADGQSVPITKLFPKRELPIFADWFTGTLHLLSAERERAPYPVFKQVTQMRVSKGTVTDVKEMHDVKITDLKAGDSAGR